MKQCKFKIVFLITLLLINTVLTHVIAAEQKNLNLSEIKAGEVKKIMSGVGFIMLLKTDNTLWWAEDTIINELQSTQELLNDKNSSLVADNVADFTVNEQSAMFLSSDGSIYVWQYTTDKVPVKMPIENVTGFSLGGEFIDPFYLAITKDGTLWSWGVNSMGQLGVGNIGDNIVKPQKVMDNVQKVVAGRNTSMVITAEGDLYAFGGNDSGQFFGNQKDSFITVPTKLMDEVTDVAVGNTMIAAIKKDKSLLAWGMGINPEKRAAEAIEKPVKIAKNVKEVSIGVNFISTVFIDDSIGAQSVVEPLENIDDTLKGVENKSSEGSMPPGLKSIGKDIAYATARGLYTYYIKKDGTVFTWQPPQMYNPKFAEAKISQIFPMKIKANTQNNEKNNTQKKPSTINNNGILIGAILVVAVIVTVFMLPKKKDNEIEK